MFFLRAVSALRAKGHDVLVTSREYREAVELAKLKSLELEVVGAHGGADRFDKLRASADRIYLLAAKVKQFRPDASFAFASPEAARVAFGLGITHIGFNDSPHAEAVGRLTVPITSELNTPWVIPFNLWTRFGIQREKIRKYHGLDPAAWLKQRNNSSSESDRTPGRQRILVRMEETKAAYIADKNLRVDIALIDALVKHFSGRGEIAILCRYEDQIRTISERYDGTATVIERVVDGTSLIESADVFIGGGGTMTSEAALMGKPTISIAPLPYYIESYLVRSGLTRRVSSAKALVSLVEKMLGDDRLRKRQIKLASRLLAEMEDPTDRIVQSAIATPPA